MRFTTFSNYDLIDYVKLVFVCLLDDLILGFCYSYFDTENRWTRTRIDYHPCITSEPIFMVKFYTGEVYY